MEKILFVVRSFSKTGPQPLRFQIIIRYLSKRFDIHVLEIDRSNEESIYNNGFWVHKIKYSIPGLILNPVTANRDVSLKNKRIAIKKIKSNIKKSIRNLIFPDTLVFEICRLNRKIKNLLRGIDYKIVIASGFPFSTLMLSKMIKEKYPYIKFIYDIGDPFYRNSQNGWLKDILALYFEHRYLKFVDKLVVIDNIVLKHYLFHYGNIINEDQIKIVPMGVSDESLRNFELSNINTVDSKQDNFIRLVYAGQLYKKFREPFELYKSVCKWNSLNEQKKIILNMYGLYREIFKMPAHSGSNIFFKGKVSNKQVIEAYFNNDIIVFLDNSEGLQIPGKIFEIAAIGKPVLFVSDQVYSPAFSIVKDMKHIYACKNDCDSILRTINSISFRVDYSEILKIRENFSWRNRAEQYSDLIYDSL